MMCRKGTNVPLSSFSQPVGPEYRSSEAFYIRLVHCFSSRVGGWGGSFPRRFRCVCVCVCVCFFFMVFVYSTRIKGLCPRSWFGVPFIFPGVYGGKSIVLTEHCSLCSCCPYPFTIRSSTHVCRPSDLTPSGGSTGGGSSGKGCKEDGCDRRPIYAYKGSKKAAYCARHR